MSPKADRIFRSRQTDGRNVGTSYGLYDLAGSEGDQTGNLTAPNHVEFEVERQVSPDMVGSLSLGTSQFLGIVTLPGGKLWECEAAFSWQGSDGAAQLCCSLYDLLADAAFGVPAMSKPNTSALHEQHSPQAKGFIDTRDRSGIVTIEFRILSGANVTALYDGVPTSQGQTWLKVRSI